jgi:WD40 repeat protein
MNLWEIGIDTASGQVRGDPRALTLPASWAGPVCVDASGDHIAYVSQATRSSLRSVSLDPETGRPVGSPVILTEGTLIVWLFQPSPNGEWIAFANEGRQEDIYLVRRDGTGLRKLTDDPHKDRGVSWWKDDRLLFFSSRTGGYEIWSIRTDGSDLVQVTETSGASLWLPRVSPDGRFMLAQNSLGTRLFDLESGDLPLAAEEARHIGAIEGSEEVFTGYEWSPDGKRILGLVGTPPATTLVVYDLEDENFRLFELPEKDDVNPIGWLADGQRFLARASGQVWQVDTRGGEPVALPLHIGSGTASISRDGQELFYVELTTRSDIWVAQFP